MPRHEERQQEGGPEAQATVMVDAVPHNGADEHAARRAHMRELTTARQAAERRLQGSTAGWGLTRTRSVGRARAEEVREELARIEAWHQTWLEEQGE